MYACVCLHVGACVLRGMHTRGGQKLLYPSLLYVLRQALSHLEPELYSLANLVNRLAPEIQSGPPERGG